MSYILGIDEAGRGAWAGPLVVGAVVLADEAPKGLTDSKLLSRSQRQRLAGLIYDNCVFAGLGWVSSIEVDRLGLTAATRLGMQRALKKFDNRDTEIIIDGSINYLSNISNSRCLIKADLTVPAVSAASIIAKVARDDYMRKIALKFPDFGFERHVGYGTKRHSDSLLVHGICAEHRISFKPVSVYA